MEKRKARALRIAAAAVLLLILGFSVYKIADHFLQEKNAKDQFSDLSAQVRAVENAAPASPDPETSDTVDDPGPRQILPQYASLHEQNPDLFGWIRIEDTPVDYPVMYTPQDPQYYLRRGFDGKRLTSGVPFVDAACPPEGNFYLIYGHHMKNKTMFGSLPAYKDPAYAERHPLIRFDTLYESRTYQVMAVFTTRIYGASETGVFKYNEYRSLTDPSRFEAYVRGVKELSLYDTGVTAAYGDELITLSTCSTYYSEDGRFVVVAKRIK